MENEAGWSIGYSLIRCFRFRNDAIGLSVVYGHNKSQHKSRWYSSRGFGVGHEERQGSQHTSVKHLKQHNESDGDRRDVERETKGVSKVILNPGTVECGKRNRVGCTIGLRQ